MKTGTSKQLQNPGASLICRKEIPSLPAEARGDTMAPFTVSPDHVEGTANARFEPQAYLTTSCVVASHGSEQTPTRHTAELG